MKRVSLVLLGSLLLLSGAALLFGAELARKSMEREVGRFLGVPVRIERLTFALRHLTLHDVSFQMPKTSMTPLRVEQVHLEGAWWDSRGTLTLTGLTLSAAGVPLRARGRVFLTRVPGSYALSEGWLDLDHPFLQGRVEISGRLLEPVVLGWLQGVRGPRRHFVGQWKIRRDSLELIHMEMQGGWSAKGKISAGPEGELHLAGPEERIRIRLYPVGAGTMGAEWWMYRPDLPARQITAEWSIHRHRLDLQAELEGTANRLSGWIGLRPPYRTRLTLQLRNFPMEEMAQWMGGVSAPALSGRLEGTVLLAGPIRALDSSGQLTLRDGWLGEVVFESIGVRFEGTGPLLRVEGTVRTPSQKVYLGDGTIDLRAAGRPEFLNALHWNSEDMDLQMAGWLMSLSPSSGSLQLQRPLGSKESLKISMQKEEHTVAVEHKEKF